MDLLADLYKACVETPGDDTVRLAFADALEEAGGKANTARALFIKKSLARHASEGPHWSANALNGTLRLGKLLSRSQFQWMPKDLKQNGHWFISHGIEPRLGYTCNTIYGNRPFGDVTPVIRRGMRDDFNRVHLLFTRGLPDTLRLSWWKWVRYHQFFADCSISRVEFKDSPGVIRQEDGVRLQYMPNVPATFIPMEAAGKYSHDSQYVTLKACVEYLWPKVTEWTFGQADFVNPPDEPVTYWPD